jgi:UDP-glucose 4-epimerase
MIRVLVTGGRGYIGGRLVAMLQADPDLAVKVASRADADDAIIVDWSDRASLEKACKNVDVVVHLAAMNEPACERDPVQALQVNGLGTLLLRQAADAAGVQRLVYLSTIKVFGNNPAGALTEENAPRPASHYAITHRIAEDYVLAGGKPGPQGIVLRLSNALGAPTDSAVNAWMLIANDLCRQAALTQRIVLRSSGLAWRNFIGMGDVVDAIGHVLTMSKAESGDELYHLGGLQSIRIWDLAMLVARRAETLFGKPVELQRVRPAPDEQHATLDWRIAKLAANGWTPRQPLVDEIDATLRLCSEVCARTSA